MGFPKKKLAEAIQHGVRTNNLINDCREQLKFFSLTRHGSLLKKMNKKFMMKRLGMMKKMKTNK